MKKLARHSDIIFFSLILFGLIVGATILIVQWKVARRNWQTNFDKYSVPPENIISGGTGRDNRIIPIDNPIFASVEIARTRLDDYTSVIVVEYHDINRAYPLNIMTAHEIVNDEIAGLPIAITFCPMCNSAVVYHREIDGQILRMGVSGNFYGNNFLMYDNLTESWWYQFTGLAVVGDYTGEQLDVVPSQVVGFYSYANRYPDGEVLIGDANRPNMNYDQTPYMIYQNSSSPVLSNDTYDPRLSAMQRVLSTNVEQTPIAYPFSILRDVGVINDVVSGYPIVAFWQAGADEVITTNNDDNAGQAAIYGRELNGEVLTFRYDYGRIFDEQTNSEWNIFGEAIAGELQGESLYNYDCYTHFWFAWSSAYPDTLLYGG